MDDDLAQKAIAEALVCGWKKAIELNKQILNKDPENVDALNRLARAYAETGNIKKAKCTSKEVLSIDPFNKIAQKCFLRWKNFKKEGEFFSHPAVASMFIEEPGKTKITPLLNLGSCKLLANLDAGDEVIINPQGQSVSILSPDGKYIGRLPDNIGARIKNLIKGGNIYQAIIKSIDSDTVQVFLREVKCTLKQHGVLSFPPDVKTF